MRNVIKGAITDGRDAYRLTDGEIASLDAPSDPATTYNKGLLMAYNLSLESEAEVNPFITKCVFPTPAPGPSARHGHIINDSTFEHSPIININGIGTNNQFSVYPNPTSGVVTFSYNIQDGGAAVRIIVTNVLGEKVADMQPAGVAGYTYWNPGNATPGIYIYTASDDKGVISKGKLVMVR